MAQAETAITKAQFGWHLETTARNLRLIREARTERGEDIAWIKELEEALAMKRQELEPAKAS
jgi:hypothetical protein